MCRFTLEAGAGHPGTRRSSDSLVVGWEKSTEIGNTDVMGEAISCRTRSTRGYFVQSLTSVPWASCISSCKMNEETKTNQS
jgi:hypothetical protein